MDEQERENLIGWLRFFGEPEHKVDWVDICDDGSAYLGLVQIRPPKEKHDGE